MELIVTTLAATWIALGFIGARLVFGKPKDQGWCVLFFGFLLTGPIIFIIGIGAFAIKLIYGVEYDED